MTLFKGLMSMVSPNRNHCTYLQPNLSPKSVFGHGSPLPTCGGKFILLSMSCKVLKIRTLSFHRLLSPPSAVFPQPIHSSYLSSYPLVTLLTSYLNYDGHAVTHICVILMLFLSLQCLLPILLQGWYYVLSLWL